MLGQILATEEVSANSGAASVNIRCNFSVPGPPLLKESPDKIWGIDV